MSEKRVSPRRKKRLACRMMIRGGSYSGVVLDISPTGMFVQTTAKPNPLDYIEVHLTLPGETEPLVMQAKVARKKVVPTQLMAVAHGGIGLQLISPPQAYREFAVGAGLAAPSDPRRARSSSLRSAGGRDPKRSAR